MSPSSSSFGILSAYCGPYLRAHRLNCGIALSSSARRLSSLHSHSWYVPLGWMSPLLPLTLPIAKTCHGCHWGHTELVGSLILLEMNMVSELDREQLPFPAMSPSRGRHTSARWFGIWGRLHCSRELTAVSDLWCFLYCFNKNSFKVAGFVHHNSLDQRHMPFQSVLMVLAKGLRFLLVAASSGFPREI